MVVKTSLATINTIAKGILRGGQNLIKPNHFKCLVMRYLQVLYARHFIVL